MQEVAHEQPFELRGRESVSRRGGPDGSGGNAGPSLRGRGMARRNTMPRL
jgi:hypothetical protein